MKIAVGIVKEFDGFTGCVLVDFKDFTWLSGKGGLWPLIRDIREAILQANKGMIRPDQDIQWDISYLNKTIYLDYDYVAVRQLSWEALLRNIQEIEENEDGR